MPGGTYQNMLPANLPPWMRAGNLSTVAEAVGAQLDANAEQVLVGRMQASVFAGGPTATRDGAARLADGRLIECEPFVLPIHSEQRDIAIYPTESTLSKRIRLSQWWQIHAQRGTHKGELMNLAPYFAEFPAIPRLRAVHQSNEASPSATWYTLDPDGTFSMHRAVTSNWNWDNQQIYRSRFWVIAYVDTLGLPAPHTWGDGGTWGDGHAWGGIFLPAQIADMIDMIREAQSAHSVLAGLIFATDPTSFDPTASVVTLPDGSTNLPDGNWGHWSKIVGGVRVPTRLATARYCEGF